MAKRYTVSKSSAGYSDWISVDHYPTSSKYTIVVTITGTLVCDIEFTIDDPSGSPVTVKHPILKSLTESLASSFPMPLRGIRANITSYTSGSVQVDVLEGDQ